MEWNTYLRADNPFPSSSQYAIKTDISRYYLLTNSTMLKHDNPKYEYVAVQK